MLCIISGMKWRKIFAVPLILVSITLSKSRASSSHILALPWAKPALFTMIHPKTTSLPVFLYNKLINELSKIPMISGISFSFLTICANSSTLSFDFYRKKKNIHFQLVFVKIVKWNSNTYIPHRVWRGNAELERT